MGIGAIPLHIYERKCIGKKGEYRQITVPNLETGRDMVCWASKEKRFDVGSVITLKGKKGSWRVECKARTAMVKDNLHTDWNVGGL